MALAISNVWLYVHPQPSMDAATQAALEITSRHQASLTLVGVLETPADPLLRTSLGQDILRLIREDRREQLAQLATEARRHLPHDQVVTTLLEGDVAWHTLTRHTLQHSPDLLVVPAGDVPVSGPFGTFSQHLFRKCPVPVWAVHSLHNRFPRRALVAVDPGATGSDARLLSKEVLRISGLLAGLGKIELHLGHAWLLLGEGLIASRLGGQATRHYLDLQLELARESIEELLKESAGAAVLQQVHLVKGAPGKAMSELSEKIDADVVILGSAARRGLQGFLIGSVAETILSGLTRSALVIKPPGFRSPVAAPGRP